MKRCTSRARHPPKGGKIIEYLNALIMLLIAAGIGVLAVVVSLILGPKKPSRAKLMAYESGNDPLPGGKERFPVHFYLVAMLFIVFDIETAFFYPIAVAYGRLGTFAFWETISFVALVLIGYIYVVRKGVLEWD